MIQNTQIMDWIPWERRKRGRPRKTWMEGVQTVMTTRNLEPDQWRNREEWRLVSGRRRQLFKKTGNIDRYVPTETRRWVTFCEEEEVDIHAFLTSALDGGGNQLHALLLVKGL